MDKLDLSQNDNWIAIVINGLITVPVIPLGPGPDMYILQESHLNLAGVTGFSEALKESFVDFGFEATDAITLRDPKLLLVPIMSAKEESIKNALVVADMALAFFNKKYFSSRARFLNWDRKNGAAIGAYLTEGGWKAIKRPQRPSGPAIVSPMESDFWDWFLGESLRNRLPPLGEALYRCIEWEREAQFSSHITHRFAFNWVGLESMMPNGECQESALIRRYSLLIGAPRGADSKVIMADSNKKSIFDSNMNPNSKLWVSSIQDMYRYRCSILHDGSSDLNSNDILPKKVDWFFYLSRALNIRVSGLAINALVDGVSDIDDFWDRYVINYLYSNKNHWISNGTFLQEDLITFDWENETYRDVI